MISITLKPEEWQVVVNVLAQAPFNVVASLIEQIRDQAAAPATKYPDMTLPLRGNGHAEGPSP